MISVLEAKKLISQHVKSSRTTSKPLLESLGLSLAEDIYSDRDYPPFNRATMDGYALASNDINKKKLNHFQIVGELLAGKVYSESIPSGSCIRIMTGAPLPKDTDCVIPVEESLQEGSSVKFDIENIKPFHNVSNRGEDCKKNELLIPKGHLCRFSTISSLATLGQTQIKVYSPPTVAIISTGDEIIPIDEIPLDHQIRDSNSTVLKAFLKDFHIATHDGYLVKDNVDQLKTVIEKGLKSDILIISGGVSMGEADFVPEVLAQLKVTKVFHKVNIKPGKPLWFGHHKDGVVFGLPGNPVSCQFGFKLFIEVYIRQFMNLEPIKPFYLSISKSLTNKKGKDLFFPCFVSEDQQLNPLENNGSGDIRATLNSDGIAFHPKDQTHLEQGSLVEFYWWRERG